MTVSPEFLEEQLIKKMIEEARARPVNPWSEARDRMLTQPGHLYAAYSAGKCWIKVGFSLNVDRRLRELNHRFPALAPFSLIGKTPSLYRAERQLHRTLAPFRFHAVGLSRELYLAIPKLEEVVQAVVAKDEFPPLTLDELLSGMRWARAYATRSGIRDHVRDLYQVAHRTGFREVA